MLWLVQPPWAKWITIGLIGCLAFWLELRPDPTVDHPFATVDIAPGDEVGPHNTEMRPLPAGMLEPPPEHGVALRPIMAGSPILESQVGDESAVIPAGWWIVGVDLPGGAVVGDRVRLVLLDSGETVEGVVASVSSDDVFSELEGAVAVDPARASEVAVAAASGRVSVLVSSG